MSIAKIMRLLTTITGIIILLGVFAIVLYNSPIVRSKAGRWVALNTASTYKSNSKLNQRPHSKLSEQDLLNFREGDIILRRGFGFVSDWIHNHFSDKYGLTHCGVLTLKDSLWQVINCESNQYHEGMQITPLQAFLNDSHPETIVVVRLNDQEQAQPIFHQWMNYYLEKQVPFDYKFDDTDSSELYCTEVIDLALQKTLGKKILTQRKNIGLITAPSYSNFMNTENFSIIINQLVD